MLAMTIGSWVLLILATIISIGIVERMKISNWYMIVVVPAVWVLCYLLIGVLKLAVGLIILLMIGAIVWGWLLKKTKKQGDL
jgi:hypothetical protein